MCSAFVEISAQQSQRPNMQSIRMVHGLAPTSAFTESIRCRAQPLAVSRRSGMSAFQRSADGNRFTSAPSHRRRPHLLIVRSFMDRLVFCPDPLPNRNRDFPVKLFRKPIRHNWIVASDRPLSCQPRRCPRWSSIRAGPPPLPANALPSRPRRRAGPGPCGWPCPPRNRPAAAHSGATGRPARKRRERGRWARAEQPPVVGSPPQRGHRAAAKLGLQGRGTPRKSNGKTGRPTGLPP